MLQLYVPYRDEDEILGDRHTLPAAIDLFEQLIENNRDLAEHESKRHARQHMIDTVAQWKAEAAQERQIDIENVDYRTAAEKALDIQEAINDPSHQRAFNTSKEYEDSFNEDQRKVNNL